MNKDQNLINEFAIKTLKENLNVMYAQIWREGQLTAEYKRMPVKTRLNTLTSGLPARVLCPVRQESHLIKG